jgi:hypothetical protein
MEALAPSTSVSAASQGLIEQHLAGEVLGHLARPALGDVESDHLDRDIESRGKVLRRRARYRVLRRLESGSDQLRDLAKNDSGEATRDHCEQKGSGDNVFHAELRSKAPPQNVGDQMRPQLVMRRDEPV